MTKAMKEMAHALVGMGKSVIIVGKDKRPLLVWQKYQTERATTDEINEWFDWHPDANLALVTGAISGVTVIDCDSEDANERFVSEYPEAKNTTIVKTPRGYHYYFQYAEGVRNDAGKKVGLGIDVRGDGGYVLCPPSINSNGDQYKFHNSLRPIQLPGTLRDKLVRVLPAGDRGRSDRNDGAHDGGDSKTRVGRGGRNQFLTRQAGTLRHFGASYDSILAAIEIVNREQCDPPLADSEVESVARSVSGYDAPPLVNEQQHHDMVVVRLDQVKREYVKWLWDKRIPLGNVTLIEGDGGVAKSWLSLVIAAHITKGAPLPGDPGARRPGNVLVFSAEDSPSQTIVGRIVDQGGDPSRVYCVAGLRDEHGERQVTLRDMPRIETLADKVKPDLIIIDPIIAYLGDKNMNDNGGIRSLLAPLHALMQRKDLAVILIRHLNKAKDQSAVYRGQGAQDFYSASRSVFHVIPDAVERNKRHFVQTKNNHANKQPVQEFSIVNNKIVFGGENWKTAEQLYAALQKAQQNGNGDQEESRPGEHDDSFSGPL